jgi:hypothetical protein
LMHARKFVLNRSCLVTFFKKLCERREGSGCGWWSWWGCCKWGALSERPSVSGEFVFVVLRQCVDMGVWRMCNGRCVWSLARLRSKFEDVSVELACISI